MKSLIAVLSLSVILVSCSKQAQVIPQNTQKIFYKDGNIAVSSMTAVLKDANTVTVSFATMYETNISKIELMSGSTENQLCTIDEMSVTTNSNQPVNYAVDDTNLKGSTMYYMLRYTLTNGDWGFTPLVSVAVK
ncbi:MAG TPA: hypothetical protein VG738_23435 [Chitinophagaceae bacterium]|nr:hypothetical protein [Chitinophagaceae bacterium]